jgi:hypothetical protein
LQWGNASVLSPAVVTRRARSCFRPDDWDLGKFTPIGRQPWTARFNVTFHNVTKANNDAEKFLERASAVLPQRKFGVSRLAALVPFAFP